MKSGNAPILTQEPQLGSKQACVLSLNISAVVYSTVHRENTNKMPK